MRLCQRLMTRSIPTNCTLSTTRRSSVRVFVTKETATCTSRCFSLLPKVRVRYYPDVRCNHYSVYLCLDKSLRIWFGMCPLCTIVELIGVDKELNLFTDSNLLTHCFASHIFQNHILKPSKSLISNKSQLVSSFIARDTGTREDES